MVAPLIAAGGRMLAGKAARSLATSAVGAYAGKEVYDRVNGEKDNSGMQAMAQQGKEMVSSTGQEVNQAVGNNESGPGTGAIGNQDLTSMVTGAGSIYGMSSKPGIQGYLATGLSGFIQGRREDGKGIGDGGLSGGLRGAAGGMLQKYSWDQVQKDGKIDGLKAGVTSSLSNAIVAEKGERLSAGMRGFGTGVLSDMTHDGIMNHFDSPQAAYVADIASGGMQGSSYGSSMDSEASSWATGATTGAATGAATEWRSNRRSLESDASPHQRPELDNLSSTQPSVERGVQHNDKQISSEQEHDAYDYQP